VRDTFSLGTILYEKIDTVFNGGIMDTIFVFSNDSNKELYSLSFVEVGFGNGNYIQDLNNSSNGRVFRWVAPDSATGALQGQFLAAVFLVTPKKQQIITIGADYAISPKTMVRTEMAMSVLDVNTFSSKDKGNDKGFAGRIIVNNIKPFSGAKARVLKTDLYFERVQKDFRPIERLRNVEFNRDWGLPFNATPADENIFSASVGLMDKANHTIKYIFSGYVRSDNYKAFRNSIVHQGDMRGWKFSNQFNYTSINDSKQSGFFIRPVIDINKQLKNFKNYQLGMIYFLEHNELKYKLYDSLNLTSFSFDTWQAYFKSPDNLPNKWGISYFTRSDKYPFGNKLIRTDRSQNINVFTELMRSEHHQFRFNTTFRKLNIIDSMHTSSKPDATILGRIEYNTNIWKGGISGNALYELGTGQEPRRDFTYLEVPAGQGVYTWIDYNNDGIQQLNEFEIARFPDQATFIRVFTPTTQFIKANYLQFNYSVTINPRAAINPAKAKGIEKLLTRVYFQSALQINQKKIADGLSTFNPFENPFGDTSLITLSKLFSNTFSFNRFSTIWGLDINNIRSSGRAFLSYGFETRKLNDWSMRGRFNIGKKFTIDMIARNLVNELFTPEFNNRNFRVEGKSLEPRFTYTKGTVLRVQAGYIMDSKKNTSGTEKSTTNSFNTEAKYNVLSNTSLTARFTYSQIEYNASPNTTVSYVMLEGLLPGKNFLWTLDLTQRLTSFLELNFQYEGRKSGTSGIVNIGRAQIRALF
jgi:hypothetical protein